MGLYSHCGPYAGTRHRRDYCGPESGQRAAYSAVAVPRAAAARPARSAFQIAESRAHSRFAGGVRRLQNQSAQF